MKQFFFATLLLSPLLVALALVTGLMVLEFAPNMLMVLYWCQLFLSGLVLGMAWTCEQSLTKGCPKPPANRRTGKHSANA